MALKSLGRRLWPQSSSRAHTHMPSYLTLEFSFPISKWRGIQNHPFSPGGPEISSLHIKKKDSLIFLNVFLICAYLYLCVCMDMDTCMWIQIQTHIDSRRPEEGIPSLGSRLPGSCYCPIWELETELRSSESSLTTKSSLQPSLNTFIDSFICSQVIEIHRESINLANMERSRNHLLRAFTTDASQDSPQRFLIHFFLFFSLSFLLSEPFRNTLKTSFFRLKYFTVNYLRIRTFSSIAIASLSKSGT